MFNLDQAIKEWRRQMAAAGIKSPEALDELEAHLRDEMEQQKLSGMGEQRAFEIAVEAIGKAAALKKEFAKESPLNSAMNPKFLRNCCFVSATFILLVNSWTLLEYELNPAERSLGLSMVALIALYIGGLPYLNRLLLGPRNAAARKAMILVCNFFLILWTILAFGSAVRIIHLPEGITPNVFAWNFYATAAATLLVLWYGRDCDSLDVLDWNSFTPTARESLEIAGAEALHFHHDFIGTEHLLLGLLGSETGIVSQALQKLGVQRESVRREIEKIVGQGPESLPASGLRYTPRAKKAIELAANEARESHKFGVDAEHIFLGLLLEGSGVAAVVLKNLGADVVAAREAIVKEIRPASE